MQKVNDTSIDEKDRKILSALFQNGRMSIAHIANKTHFQRNLVMRRLSRMMKEKIITGFIPIVNPSVLGYPNVAMVLIKTKASSSDIENKFLKFLISNKHITWVSKIIGKYDFQCAVVHKDTLHLNEIVSLMKSYMPGMIEDMEVFQIAHEPKVERINDLL